jgi:hypothetical protein
VKLRIHFRNQWQSITNTEMFEMTELQFLSRNTHSSSLFFEGFFAESLWALSFCHYLCLVIILFVLCRLFLVLQVFGDFQV